MISVLVVYASFGEGHKKAAEAIGDFFDVPTCDLLDFTHPLVRYAYQKGYIFITQHLPTFWKFIFFLARWNSFSKIAHYFQKLFLPSFFYYLRDKKPELIITTHFSASRIIAMIKNDIGSSLVAVVSFDILELSSLLFCALPTETYSV